MSKEELNQELSTDDLKDVAGGIGALKSSHVRDAKEAKWSNRLTTKGKYKESDGSVYG
tara:strand:+ start:367 stop:540 length:174 start_codon:yes stop_codon:yes gene_type:complete